MSQYDGYSERWIQERVDNLPPVVKIDWAPGWNPERLLQQQFWGFKGTSSYVRTLHLGDIVKRLSGQGRPIKPCTSKAVHIAVDPWHEYVRYHNGSYNRTVRRTFYIAVMNPRPKPIAHGWYSRYQAKWAGSSYRVVAKVRRIGGSIPTREIIEAHLREET